MSKVLLVGGPGAGKTVYGTQVLLRVRRKPGVLTVRGAPENIAPLEHALDRLERGVPPEHTSAGTYHEVALPLVTPGGDEIDLIWPDYGGEQMDQMVTARRVAERWRERTSEATAWFLFVRAPRATPHADVISRPESAAEDSATPASTEAATVAGAVELLQFLRYVRGISSLDRVDTPRLALHLSCWDELPTADRKLSPSEFLAKRLPLLDDMARANWADGAVHVFGLSAQGRKLRRDKPDQDYIDQGPEEFGYVVAEDGALSTDLTLPLAWALGGTG